MKFFKAHTAKVITFICIIVIAIISSGILSTNTLTSSSKKLETQIDKIEATIKTKNWSKASSELDAMKTDWKGLEPIWTVLLDHIEIDNIDNSISRVSTLIESKNTPLSLAEASTLKQFIKHIPEKESFNLKNIF